MKNLKGGLHVLTAVNLFILTSCCCLVCKGQPINVIQDPSFEIAMIGAGAYSQHVATYCNDPKFPPTYSSIDDLGIWNISLRGGVALGANNGRPQTPLLLAYWPSLTDTNCASCATCTNGTWCINTVDANECWNTPDGYQFISLGVNPNPAGSGFAATTLSQVVPLKHGFYKLSFLQSAFNHVDSRDQLEGQVEVQILSHNGRDVLVNSMKQPPIFIVPGGTNWVTQSTDVDIPTEGNYTIQFSNVTTTSNTYGGYPALIDAVSLVKK